MEIVRRTAEAFNEGGIERAAEFFAEEVEFREPPEQPAPRIARGREEAVRMFTEFDEAWVEHRTEPEEVRAIGEDKVLVLSTEHFRGRDGDGYLRAIRRDIHRACRQDRGLAGLLGSGERHRRRWELRISHVRERGNRAALLRDR